MTEQTARAEEMARDVAHPWCVADSNCEEDASNNAHSAECDMLTGQIDAAITAERASADRRVRDAENAMAERAAECADRAIDFHFDGIAVAAAIRALKSPEP